MLLQAARRPDGSLSRHTVPGGVGERRRARRVSDRTATRTIHGHSRAGENAADLQKRWSSRLHPYPSKSGMLTDSCRRLNEKPQVSDTPAHHRSPRCAGARLDRPEQSGWPTRTAEEQVGSHLRPTQSRTAPPAAFTFGALPAIYRRRAAARPPRSSRSRPPGCRNLQDSGAPSPSRCDWYPYRVDGILVRNKTSSRRPAASVKRPAAAV